jgi:hypothetical protein
VIFTFVCFDFSSSYGVFCCLDLCAVYFVFLFLCGVHLYQFERLVRRHGYSEHFNIVIFVGLDNLPFYAINIDDAGLCIIYPSYF